VFLCTAFVSCIFIHITKFITRMLFLCAALVFWVFIHCTNYIITVHFTAAPKKLLNHHHHGEHCKSKTDSQHWHQGEKKTIHGKGKSHTNDLPLSPRSRADRAAHRGTLLNPTDVVELNPTNVELNPTNVDLNSVLNPALSGVNPFVSEINYGILSPA
jgi:hypothetical protein